MVYIRVFFTLRTLYMYMVHVTTIQSFSLCIVHISARQRSDRVYSRVVLVPGGPPRECFPRFWEEGETRRNTFVFIGRDLDKDFLVKGFKECQVTAAMSCVLGKSSGISIKI